MRRFRVAASVACAVVSFWSVTLVAAVQWRAAPETALPPHAWRPPPSFPLDDAATPPVRASLLPSPAASAVAYAPARPSGSVRLAASRSAPLVSRLKIKQRVVFITIDDGNTRDQRVLELIRKTHLPVSLFLVNAAVNRDPPYWQAMARAGAKIEDHTLSHPRLTRMSYTAQRRQICGPLGRYRSLFGRRPTLFRAPYGAQNAATLRAVSSCGLGAAVNWSATMGGGVIKTWANGRLRSGDIILLHFKPSLYNDLLKLMRVLRDERFGVGLLEDYLTFASQPAARRAPPTPRPSGTSPSPSPSAALTPLPTPAQRERS